MNMKVLLHLCLTAGSYIYSVPIANAHVREQQELLHEQPELGAEGGTRAGYALSNRVTRPSRAKTMTGTASLSGPRKGDSWARAQPGSPGKDKRRQSWNGCLHPRSEINPGRAASDSGQLRQRQEQAPLKHDWNTTWARLRSPAWAKTETPEQCTETCGDAPGAVSQDLPVWSERWQSVSVPIQPACSHVTNCRVTAGEISPAHIKMVDWGQRTCLNSLTWAPSQVPSAYCSRAPFRLKPGQPVCFHHPAFAWAPSSGQGSHYSRLGARSRSSLFLLLRMELEILTIPQSLNSSWPSVLEMN